MSYIESDKPVEHCGVVGAVDFSGRSIAKRTVVMMNALDHRGQDSAGFAVGDGSRFRIYKRLGTVAQIFREKVLERRSLEGNIAVGHNRYKIQGGDTLAYTQPIRVRYKGQELVLAHNGNIPDLEVIQLNLFRFGVRPHYRFDSDALAQSIVSAPGHGWIEKVQNGLEGVVGSYSLVMATADGSLIATRDPWGNRPLSVAEIDQGMVVASETVAFDQLKTHNRREIAPGEILEIRSSGEVRQDWLLQEAEHEANCIFEGIYLAYETSQMWGTTISKFRDGLGRVLADRFPNWGEVVSAIPESSRVSARSYAYHSGLPEEGLIVKKPHRIKRSFMSGEMGNRRAENDAKFNFSPDAKGRRVVTVDDSVIVGNTAEIAVENFREQAEPAEVNFLSTAPKVVADCPYGVNMRSSDGEFAAYDAVNNRVRNDVEIARRLGVDRIGFTSIDDVLEVIEDLGGDSDKFCLECFGGKGLGRLRYRGVGQSAGIRVSSDQQLSQRV